MDLTPSSEFRPQSTLATTFHGIPRMKRSRNTRRVVLSSIPAIQTAIVSSLLAICSFSASRCVSMSAISAPRTPTLSLTRRRAAFHPASAPRERQHSTSPEAVLPFSEAAGQDQGVHSVPPESCVPPLSIVISSSSTHGSRSSSCLSTCPLYRNYNT